MTYLIGIYGPTEAEVKQWGLVAVLLGILKIFINLKKMEKRFLFKLIITTVILSMQIFPIILWFVFHGQGISDGTPPSTFIAHWAFSIPHIVILILCILNIIYWRRTI